MVLQERKMKSPMSPKGKIPLSRSPLARMLKIHEQLEREKCPNCRKLADSLEVSTKTIQRDQMELPIEYDPSRFGYFYDGEVSHFPTIMVTEGEILALFVAQQALKQYRGTSFAKPLESAFRKLASSMQEEVSIDPTTIEAPVSFTHTGRTEPDINISKRVIRATRKSKELHFSYQNLKSSY